MLAAKIMKEGEAEEKAFQEYSDWCTETKALRLKQAYLTMPTLSFLHNAVTPSGALTLFGDKPFSRESQAPACTR